MNQTMDEAYGDGATECTCCDKCGYCIEHGDCAKYGCGQTEQKEAQNLVKWSPFPKNCFVGVTATDTQMAWIGSKYLQTIDAKVKFVSLEPLLTWDIGKPGDLYCTEQIMERIDWLIIGAQTNPTVYPEIEWVEEIVTAADKAGVKVFLKQNLWDLLYSKGWDNDLFWANDKATLRQEFPI